MSTPSAADSTGPRFAPLHFRIRALAIDTALLAAVFIGVALAVDAAQPDPSTGRAIWLTVMAGFFLYEPLCVWRRGATAGHALVGLVVRAPTPNGRPSLPRAFQRFFTKTVLGILSFLTVLLTRRHQAIHDLVSQTTMEVSEAGAARGVHYLSERAPVAEALPSAPRRVVVMLLYQVLVFALFTGAFGAVVSTSCLDMNVCSADDDALSALIGAVWLVAALGVAVSCWRGTMWGARAHP